jgi:hypothetical protein
LSTGGKPYGIKANAASTTVWPEHSRPGNIAQNENGHPFGRPLLLVLHALAEIDLASLDSLLQGVHEEIVVPLEIEGAMLCLGLPELALGVHIKSILAIKANIDMGMVEKGTILYGTLDGLLAHVANQVFHVNGSFVSDDLHWLFYRMIRGLSSRKQKKSECSGENADS